MIHLAAGWTAAVERGPDWVFVRLESHTAAMDASGVAEELWSVLEKHFTYRLIVELEGVGMLASSLIGQLMMLQKRVHAQGGLMRICGLNQGAQNALMFSRLHSYLPIYDNRHDALLGRPKQPR